MHALNNDADQERPEPAQSDSWEAYCDCAEQIEVPDDFMADGGDAAPQKRDVF